MAVCLCHEIDGILSDHDCPIHKALLTEPGFYWWRATPHARWEVKEVLWKQSHGERYLVGVMNEWSLSPAVEHAGGEWWPEKLEPPQT